MSFYSGKNNSNSADINSLTTQVAGNTSSLAEIAQRADVKVLTEFGALTDGSADIVTAINDAIASFEGDTVLLRFPDGVFLLNSDIVITNKHVYIYMSPNAEIIGTGSITIDSTLSGTGWTASNVVKGDSFLTSSAGVLVGDYIEIAGTINHENYIPSRYSSLKFVAKVIDISGGKLILDRKIMYNLSSVTLKKIDKPFYVMVEGNGVFNGAALSINHMVGGNIHFNGKGVRAGNCFGIQQSCDFEANATINNASVSLGSVVNDCNNFIFTSKTNRVGLTDGSGTKAFRANGIQQAKIYGNFMDSLRIDSTIYGARNLEMHVKSIGSNRYPHEQSDTTSNRCEAIQFSECDNLDVWANMDLVDDQAIEFLRVDQGRIFPYINGLDGSTEGAIVIKKACRDIEIVNPKIRCYNPYGIKIECASANAPNADPSLNDVDYITTQNVKIIQPDIINYKSGNVGVQVRDSASLASIGVKVLGGYIKSYAPISVNANHNDVFVKGTIVESTGGHAITGLADYLRVENVDALGCNDTTIRAVVSSGANDKISNVSSDGAIYVRDQSRFNFSLNRFNANKVPRIYLDQDAYSFYIDKGQFKIDAPPTLYTIENGTRLYKRNIIAGDNDGWACVRSGSNYPDWTTGISYVVGQYVNNGGNVYKCKTAGTSGATAPTGTGTGISDGACVWDYVSAYTTFTINPFGSIRKRVGGQVTIPAGTTQVTVTHNLGVNPLNWGPSVNKTLSSNAFMDSVNSTTAVIHIPSTATDVFCTYWVEG